MTLQVMTKIAYTPEFQSINLPFLLMKLLHEQEESFSTIKNQRLTKHQNHYQNHLLL